jgi:6-phosphogluconolactonase (cycloisomerase 2 family)
MKLSLFGRLAMAAFASLVLGLGMTACGGGTIGYMWVLGSQYNQIAAFKIDDYTGNLTQVPGAPFTSHGTNPVSIVVKPGGRYIYVINQGAGGGQGTKGTGAGIELFSVGGDGVLTFQQEYQTQGYVSQWAEIGNGGSTLYVLDKYSPSGDGNGAITAFNADSSTGRLTLVTNTQILQNGVATTYFEVGASPFMMRATAGCLFTVNSTGNTITPYAVSGSQLSFTTTQTFTTGATTITSINVGGNYVYLTDSGQNVVYQYSVGGNCSLAATTGNKTPNLTGTSNPTYSFVDSSAKHLYVLNQSTTSTQSTTPFSSISAYTLDPSTAQPQPIVGSPYTVGSGPVCMLEDPSGQYMYISNKNDGTVTGKLYDPNTGILSQLSRGSTFPSTGQAGCLAVSGAVN